MCVVPRPDRVSPLGGIVPPFFLGSSNPFMILVSIGWTLIRWKGSKAIPRLRGFWPSSSSRAAAVYRDLGPAAAPARSALVECLDQGCDEVLVVALLCGFAFWLVEGEEVVLVYGSLVLEMGFFFFPSLPWMWSIAIVHFSLHNPRKSLMAC